jgi:hypothetical protein
MSTPNYVVVVIDFPLPLADGVNPEQAGRAMGSALLPYLPDEQAVHLHVAMTDNGPELLRRIDTVIAAASVPSVPDTL